mgnify:CR=1 FL=1
MIVQQIYRLRRRLYIHEEKITLLYGDERKVENVSTEIIEKFMKYAEDTKWFKYNVGVNRVLFITIVNGRLYLARLRVTVRRIKQQQPILWKIASRLEIDEYPYWKDKRYRLRRYFTSFIIGSDV